MSVANLDGRAVLITDAGAVDVATATGGELGPAPQSVFDGWDDFVAAAASIDGTAAVPYDSEQLGPPSPTPRQVFAIGLNYRAHAEESGQPLPEMPATFTKFPSCLNGPYGAIELPADTVDWEVELVVVIGREAVDVDLADAWHTSPASLLARISPSARRRWRPGASSASASRSARSPRRGPGS